jgi:predicted NACHT family NTPase
VFRSTNKRLKVEYPTDILSKWNKSLFIVGAPGYGKTSFCRWRALQDAERFNAKKSNIIPIYVSLHKLSRKPLARFEETFLEGLGQSALIGDIDKQARHNVRLYLDGLDEVGSPDHRRAIVDLARKGVEQNIVQQIVLTSRDYIYGKWLNWMPKINLSPFNDSQIKEFIDKWLGRGTDINRRFRQQLAILPTIHNLMGTPLLATLTIMVFRQTSRLPESKTRLYDMFIELLSGGWDIVKGVLRGSTFGPRVKVVVLSSLAGNLHERRLREFNDEDIEIAIKTALPRAKASDCKRLRDELIVDGIISFSGGVLQFSHLSFQEFLAARDFMGSPYPDRASRALKSYLSGDNWWRDVLKFYVGLSSGPIDICDWLCRNIIYLKNRDREEVSTQHAHELLASVLESFPECTIEELARRVRGPLDSSSVVSFLKRVHKRRSENEPALNLT